MADTAGGAVLPRVMPYSFATSVTRAKGMPSFSEMAVAVLAPSRSNTSAVIRMASPSRVTLRSSTELMACWVSRAKATTLVLISPSARSVSFASLIRLPE